MADFQCGGLIDLGPKLLSQSAQIIREYHRLVARAGNGCIAEARAEQVRMNAGVCVNEDALCCKPLGTVAGNGVAVIEVAVVSGIELDSAVIIEPRSNSTIQCDRLDEGEIAVGGAERFVRGRELDPVADREFVGHFPVDTDAS